MKHYHIILILLFTSCAHQLPPATEIRLVVEVVYPQMGKQTVTLAASGMIANSEEISLSFKTGGMVEQVNAEEGQYVQKGALLARLNITELDAQLQQSDLNISKLQRDESRLIKLVKDTTATIEQLQNTQTSLSTAKEQKRGLEYNKQQGYLYAPSAGFILKRTVNPGEFKSPGSPVFTLGSNTSDGKWVFKISVSDKDRIQLHMDQKTMITLDALPGKSFNGNIIKLSSIPDAQTGTYDCYVSFDPGTTNIVYGLTGKLSVEYESSEAYTTLPLDALTGVDGNDAIVYTIGADSLVERKSVHIHSINSKTVSIEEQLNAAVITAGKNDVIPGKRVKIK